MKTKSCYVKKIKYPLIISLHAAIFGAKPLVSNSEKDEKVKINRDPGYSWVSQCASSLEGPHPDLKLTSTVNTDPLKNENPYAWN